MRRIFSSNLPADPVGARLGGYLIEGLLGEGSMGKVYRALQISLQRPVAIKMISGPAARRNDLLARFLREARIAALLSHPNLVQVYDCGHERGAYFYVMELVDGLSLGSYMRQGDGLTEGECVEVAREVTLALEVVHEAGVIHRDLKPDNLLLTSKGVVKLADLGLARVHFLDDVTPTNPSLRSGTPHYMSPEQVQGDEGIDHRSDFYGLGATLFHLATGQVPYDGETADGVLLKLLNDPVPDPRDLNPTLSEAFALFIRQLLSKGPGGRPDTHAEILHSLEHCRAEIAERTR